jgi:hypothetical protein
MNRKLLLAVSILLGVLIVAALIFLAFYRPVRTANLIFTNPTIIRAMRVDYLDEQNSRVQVAGLETDMQKSGVNMVAVGAGRVDWTYFQWRGYQDRWSEDVKSSGQDFLMEDSTRFGKWAHVSAVVDVLAPLYIRANPQAASISWTGLQSKDLVGTMELVDGQFGQELLSMIQEIATYYPVNSITLTELVYYTDGFGAPDKAAYMAYTHTTDWPRKADGSINIDEPSIGVWRSYEIGRFLQKAAGIMHQHGKQLFLESHIGLDSSGRVLVENGTDFTEFLKYADRLVVRGNNDPGERSQAALTAISQYLKQYPSHRVITGIGLWRKDYDPNTPRDQMTVLPVGDLKSALQGIGKEDLWITPSFLMTGAHWQVLEDFWNSQPK